MYARSQKPLIRITGALLVAMVSLASARSLIPGLCATQAALQHRAESGAATCCDAPAQRAEGDGTLVRSNAVVVCAFCKLATTLVTASSVVHFEGVNTLVPATVPALESVALVEGIDQAHAGRAPPTIHLA